MNVPQPLSYASPESQEPRWSKLAVGCAFAAILICPCWWGNSLVALSERIGAGRFLSIYINGHYTEMLLPYCIMPFLVAATSFAAGIRIIAQRERLKGTGAAIFGALAGSGISLYGYVGWIISNC